MTNQHDATPVDIVMITRARANLCPVCGADATEYDGIHVNPCPSRTQATQDGKCTECGSEWTDTYKITDVEITKGKSRE